MDDPRVRLGSSIYKNRHVGIPIPVARPPAHVPNGRERVAVAIPDGAARPASTSAVALVEPVSELARMALVPYNSNRAAADNEGDAVWTQSSRALRADALPKVQYSFPWYGGFYKAFCESHGEGSVDKHLAVLELLNKNAKESMPNCYSNRQRALRLLTAMERVLPSINDVFAVTMEKREDYLRVMTGIVAMFLDLKIRSAELSRKSLKKLGFEMNTAMSLYLFESEPHISEAILMTKYFNKQNQELCSPVLRKFITEASFIAFDEAGYLRYILIYRLWRKLEDSTDKRMAVVKNAVAKLNPGPLVMNAVNDMAILAKEVCQAAITKVHLTTHLILNLNYDKMKLSFLKDYSLVLEPNRRTTDPFMKSHAPLSIMARPSISPATWQRATEMGDDSDEVQELHRISKQPRSKVIHVIDISGDSDEEIEMKPLDPVPRVATAPPPPALVTPPPPPPPPLPVSVQVPAVANAPPSVPVTLPAVFSSPAALAPSPARVQPPPPAPNPIIVNPASVASPAPSLVITSRGPTNAATSLSGSPVSNSTPTPWGSPIQGLADSTTGPQQVNELDSSSVGFEHASPSPESSLGVEHEEPVRYSSRRVSSSGTEPPARRSDIRVNFSEDFVMDGFRNANSKRRQPPFSAAPPLPCKGAFDLTVGKRASPPLAPEAAQIVLTPPSVMSPRVRQPSTPRLPQARHRLNSQESPSLDRSSSSTASTHTLSRPWLDNNSTNSKPCDGNIENSSRVRQIMGTSGYAPERNVAYCVLPSYDSSSDPQASGVNGCAPIYFTQPVLKRKEGGLENCRTSFVGSKRTRYEDDRHSSHVDLPDLHMSAAVTEPLSADLSSYGLGPIGLYPKDTALSELAPMQNEDVEDAMTGLFGSHRITGWEEVDSWLNDPNDVWCQTRTIDPLSPPDISVSPLSSTVVSPPDVTPVVPPLSPPAVSTVMSSLSPPDASAVVSPLAPPDASAVVSPLAPPDSSSVESPLPPSNASIQVSPLASHDASTVESPLPPSNASTEVSPLPPETSVSVDAIRKSPCCSAKVLELSSVTKAAAAVESPVDSASSGPCSNSVSPPAEPQPELRRKRGRPPKKKPSACVLLQPPLKPSTSAPLQQRCLPPVKRGRGRPRKKMK